MLIFSLIICSIAALIQSIPAPLGVAISSVVMFSALMFVHKGFSLPLHHAQHYFLFWSKALVRFLNYGHQYVGLTIDLLVLSGFQQEIDHYSYFEF
jgi:hypothetical protein